MKINVDLVYYKIYEWIQEMRLFLPLNDSMLISYNEQTRSAIYFTLLYEPFNSWKHFFHCVWVCFQFSLLPNLLPTCPLTNGHYILLKLTFLWLHTSFLGSKFVDTIKITQLSKMCQCEAFDITQPGKNC